MTDEELCGWLRSMLPASGFAPTENWAPWLGADRIEQLEREKAVVSDLWEQQKEIALDYLADCNALSAEIERLQLLCDLNAVPAGIIEDRGRMEERAAIVAWLRREDDRLTNGGVLTDADYLASAIEAGEHLK